MLNYATTMATNILTSATNRLRGLTTATPPESVTDHTNQTTQSCLQNRTVVDVGMPERSYFSFKIEKIENHFCVQKMEISKPEKYTIYKACCAHNKNSKPISLHEMSNQSNRKAYQHNKELYTGLFQAQSDHWVQFLGEYFREATVNEPSIRYLAFEYLEGPSVEMLVNDMLKSPQTTQFHINNLCYQLLSVWDYLTTHHIHCPGIQASQLRLCQLTKKIKITEFENATRNPLLSDQEKAESGQHIIGISFLPFTMIERIPNHRYYDFLHGDVTIWEYLEPQTNFFKKEALFNLTIKKLIFRSVMLGLFQTKNNYTINILNFTMMMNMKEELSKMVMLDL